MSAATREATRRFYARLKEANPERYRAMRREEQRRYRERKHQRGLTSAGTPIKRPDIARTKRAQSGLHWDHPEGCPCYDCLFAPVEYQPTVYRAGVQA